MTTAIGLVILGVFLLIIGAHTVVKGASAVAIFLKMTPSVIGLTIVAAGTSLPELFVGLSATLNQHFDLVMGNVIGSNILNIAFVIGLSSLITPLSIKSQSYKVEWPIMFLITLLAVAFLVNLNATRMEGFILFLSAVFAMVFFVRFAKKAGTIGTEQETKEISELTSLLEKKDSIWIKLKYGVFVLFGFLSLTYGSDAFVKGASDLSRLFGLSERVIGITVVAIGTSLPELFVSVVATFKGRSDVAIGNIIGSNIFNMAGILGVCSLITPFQISKGLIAYDVPWLIGISLLFFIFMFKSKKLDRWKGGLLFASYAIYTMSLFH